MADKKIHLRIVSPVKLVFESDVDMVILRTLSGDMGILPGHENTTTLLDLGVLRVKLDGKDFHVSVLGGFCEISKNSVTILTDVAETADDIDVDRALSAKERAEKRMASKEVDMDTRRAELALRRSLVRLEVYNANKGK